MMLIGEELQRLYFNTLTGTPAIMALAYRVYDNVDAGKYGDKNSYISFGAYDTTDEGADCIDGLSVTHQIDVWTRVEKTYECGNIVELIRKALHEQELTLADNAMCETRVVLTRVFRDPDGKTHHGVVQVTASVEVPE